MSHEAINATLCLEAMRVIGCSVHDGVVELVVETEIPSGRCPSCLDPSTSIKDRPVVHVRDLPISGHATVLAWRKKRWACDGCGRTFTETHPEIPPRARMTRRLRRHLGDQAVDSGNFSGVARSHGVSYHAVAVAHRQLAELIEADKRRATPTVIALDECSFGAGHDYVTVVSDLLLGCAHDVIKGRHDQDIHAWMRLQSQEFLEAIEVVVVDLWPPFRRMIETFLPKALLVADKFHVIRLGCDAVDRIRKRLQGRSRTRGENAHIYAARSTLLVDPAKLGRGQVIGLEVAFAAEQELYVAHHLLQMLRAIYACSDRSSAQRALQLFVDTAEATGLREFATVARAVRRRSEEILNYHDARVTTALAEGTNTKIQLLKRQAFGIQSFSSFRERILVQCGRPKPGKPRLVA